jgi:hypothetical protein
MSQQEKRRETLIAYLSPFVIPVHSFLSKLFCISGMASANHTGWKDGLVIYAHTLGEGVSVCFEPYFLFYVCVLQVGKGDTFGIFKDTPSGLGWAWVVLLSSFWLGGLGCELAPFLYGWRRVSCVCACWCCKCMYI